MPIPLTRTTLAFALLSTALFQGTPSAQNRSCAVRANNTHEKLLQCVTADGVNWHLAALQTIADENGGTRAAGTPGYDASVRYVAEQLTAAGYNVTLHPFPILYYPPAILQQLTPSSASYETGTFTGSGSGTVTASVTAVDINLTPPRASTSGCEAADFAGFTVGDIALIQRGTCTFGVKAQNAEAAGASAVIIFNQGDTPARQTLFIGTLVPTTVTIPVVGASFTDGQNLAQPGSSAAITVPPSQVVTQYNVIAESVGGDPNNVVMAGAHLDSVLEGPGIQDNGSGSAALIEIAKQMARVRPRNKVRFAWWGAEEMGLIGSRAYVAGLSDADRARIALYLNFDMIGSPNYGFFIYDGDDSDGIGAGPGPDGSGHIEQTFQDFFDARGLAHKGTDFSGRSDYGPFIAVGIPSGGVFAGAEGVKTAEEANLWGGTAGEQFDPCYHLACDTLANVNMFALEVNTDAAAYAILQYAMTTQGVNGQRGKGNFKP